MILASLVAKRGELRRGSVQYSWYGDGQRVRS